MSFYFFIFFHHLKNPETVSGWLACVRHLLYCARVKVSSGPLARICRFNYDGTNVPPRVYHKQ